MKYEMIFGDQKRFNEQNNEMTEVMLWHDCLGPNFVSIKELSRMNLEGAIPHGSVVLAMRRIIQEPKRWTVEDQKAGRLPEVGAELLHESEGYVNFVGEFDFRWMLRTKEGGLYLAEKFYCSPLETPEEKAQREEDEFVSLVESKYNHMPNEISFRAGIRAAYRKLKDLLTKEEFQAAQDSTENAHYTSKPIIQAIWKIAERLGYNGGRVLELGAGIGHFAGLVPARVRGATQFTMVERDSVSSRIVKMLYPNHEVVAGDMEEFKAVPGSVTIGIGNVPFAGGTVGDSVRRYNEPLNLHNYTIARHLDAVAPGGIVVAISSHSTLDANIKQRKFLATKGELIGAIRLPNDAFAENAKTDVVTDILIFRRPRQGDGTLGVRIDQNADVKVKNKDGEEVSRAINKYFTDNPEMVLGKHSAKGSMYGPDEYTVESTPGDLQAKLDAAE